MQVLAAVLGWLAARHLGPEVARGFARWLPALVARAAAGTLLFTATFVLAGLLGGALLRAGGLSRLVKGGPDRGVGALLGGVKGGLVLWVLLSALALLHGPVGTGALRVDPRGSDLAALARRHNLLVRLDPSAAHTLERVVDALRDPAAAKRLERDPDARRLLADPRVRDLARARERGADLDEGAAARVLEDPELRGLVERLRMRHGGVAE